MLLQQILEHNQLIISKQQVSHGFIFFLTSIDILHLTFANAEHNSYSPSIVNFSASIWDFPTWVKLPAQIDKGIYDLEEQEWIG